MPVQVAARWSSYMVALQMVLGVSLILTIQYVSLLTPYLTALKSMNSKSSATNEMNTKSAAEAAAQHGGYLVFCKYDRKSLSPVHMFQTAGGYELLTLDDPPPLNTTHSVVLITTGNKVCKETTYYKEALRLRAESQLISSPSLYNNSWVHEVFWPDTKSPFLRSAVGRPLLVALWGEVFWGKAYGSCAHVDMVVYRSKVNAGKDCLTVHIIQGVTHAYRHDAGNGYSMNSTLLLSSEMDPPDLEQAFALNKPKHFCAMFTSSIKRQFYYIDALVRYAAFELLSEYKPCLRPGISANTSECPGSDLDAYRCLQDYKFAITMENTQEYGYLSEKLFQGVLAGRNTVPIYFGAPDVDQYINPGRAVICNMSVDFVQEMRSKYYPDVPGKAKKDRVFLINTTNSNPTDEELIAWATEYLRPVLAPCIERVKMLDNDQRAFQEVTQQPLVRNPDLLTGVEVFQGIDIALKFLRNERSVKT